MFVLSVDFASIVQQKSVCTPLIVGRSPVDGLDPKDACMVGEQRVDPPAMKRELRSLDNCLSPTLPG